jgi:hypothetical protein
MEIVDVALLMTRATLPQNIEERIPSSSPF